LRRHVPLQVAAPALLTRADVYAAWLSRRGAGRQIAPVRHVLNRTWIRSAKLR
jgi:hypothetical protein